MNFALIMGLILLLGSPIVWAKGSAGLQTDSIIISGYVDTSVLWQIPYIQRKIGDFLPLTPPTSDTANFQTDISSAQNNLKDGIKFLSDPTRRQPTNLDSAIKEYLSHAPQDTESMIDKFDTYKTSPSNFYGKDLFAGYSSFRSWTILPQELPKPNEFTAQEQIWEKEHLPIGRLGLSFDNHQWNYGLSTYEKNNWDWNSGYKLGESLGINGPVIAFGKSSFGTDLSFYSSNGNFVGDVTPIKLKEDPYAIYKYFLKASYPNAFGTVQPYDRGVNLSDDQIRGVLVYPYNTNLADSFHVSNKLSILMGHDEEYWEELEDCDDDDYYDYHEDECDDFYYYNDPPYDFEIVRYRSVLEDSQNPNDPLFPKLKAKKKSGGVGVMSGLFSLIAPTGPVSVQDGSDEGDVTVIDQYSLPQIGYTDKSDPNSAWNAVDPKGPNVTVAVIDSGVDLTHPDGPEFIWSNPADGTHGWNFIDENSDLRDLRGHGTMVAGIIAAKTNNGIGMAGINAGAVIMPLRVADKKGIANSLNIYRAIHYAVDHGAQVINISLGGVGVSKLENLAINYAKSHNVLVVIASGNTENDIETFGPSSSGSAMAVGATNYDGSRGTVSNWGANNSLMAPGEQIFSLQSKDAPWQGAAGQRDRLYTKESGTSFSSPMVAATASLLLVKNPNYTVDQLEDILLFSAKPVDKLKWNGLSGAGLLDAAKALRTDPQDTFNIKITKIKTIYKDKKLQYVDVYATVREAVDYFTVEVGRGKYAHSFKPIIGIAGQQADDDLVAHISNDKLRGSDEWILVLRAIDKSGKEYLAQTPLTIK